MIQNVPIRWKLKSLLQRHDIKTRTLAEAIKRMGGKTHAVTLYRITGRNTEIKPTGMNVLEDVIHGLESLTGQTYTPNDLLEVVRDG